MTDREPAEIAVRIRDAERGALARGMTWLEREDDRGQALLRELAPLIGRAGRIGVTGPPGSGKSTLVAALAARLSEADRRVGVVAVDPSSRITGGALLGDRIRMGAVAAAERVFIRSMASRGAFGGLAPTSESLADLLDAAGYDPVILETVGVGQSEVEVAHAADTTVVVLAPGSGDGVQALKAGLAEVADVVVMNKADLEGAELAASTIEAALALRAPPADGWRVPVTRAAALHGTGVDDVLGQLERHRAHLAADGRLAGRRRRNLRRRILLSARHRLTSSLLERLDESEWARLLDDVIAGRETADGAAARLIGRHPASDT